MQLLSNLKVGGKIYLVLSLLSVVAISIGILGLISLKEANNGLRTVYEDRVIPLKQLKIVSDMYAVNVVDTCHKVRNGNLSWAEGTKNIDEATNVIKKEWADYTATKLVDKEEKIIKEVQPLLKNADVSIAKAREFMQRQDKDGLANYTINELYSNIDPISGKITELIDLQLEVAKQEYDSAQRAYKNFRILFSGILIGGIGFAIFISVMIIRMITNQIDTMVKSIHKDERGFITVKQFTVTSQDELGILGTALNTFIAQVRDFVGQVAGSAESVSTSSQQLTTNSEETAQASSQVAATIASVAQGMEEQLKSIDATSVTIQDISSSIQQIAANTRKVAVASDKTANAAQEGGKAVNIAVSQMNTIEMTVLDSAELVTRLGQRSREIGQIVDAISGIAAQTNLLALNAAIEAARAGEQGRGFSVVAEEVRKLAEQSQEATKQIASLISEVQGETEKAVLAMNNGTREVKIGSEVVNSAGQAFTQIRLSVDEVSNQMREISTTIEQVALGSQAIVTTIHDIDAVSRDTAAQTQSVSAATEEQAASSQEISASSQILAKMADDLQQAVKQFVI